MSEITDFIDVRSVNKHAFTMLKSSVSVDKSIHHTYRTRVKAVPSEYNNMSLSEGSESVNTEYVYKPLTVLAHRPSSVREAHFIQLRNAKDDETNKKVWEVFKAYEVGTGDIPFDSIETAIPVDKLEEAMETLFLCEVIGNLSAAKEALKGLYYENSMLTFHEFKELVHYVVLLQEQKTRKRSPLRGSSSESVISANHSAASVPDSFQTLVQKQRMVSALVLDDLVDAASVSQSSSNMKLGGKMMNTSVFKDAVMDVLNEDYRSRRPLPPHKLAMLRKNSIRSFNDSRDDIDLDVGSIQGSEPPPTPGTAAGSVDSHNLPVAEPQKRKVNRNPVEMMQKTRVAGLMNPEEEYHSKWLRMKEKRDARLQREFKRKVREDLMHTFQSVVNRSQKNESMKAKQDMRDFRKMEEHNNRVEAQRRKRILQEGLQNRMHAEQTRKRREVKYIRETLKSAAALSAEMKREDTEMKLMHSRSLTPFELDASSSTIINIPDALISRVKNAKSLLAYEAAKKEVKAFYENTLSERINAFSKSKEFAVKRAAQFGTPITLAPMEGEFFFDDSICDDSDSESLAIKEYFKHRGRQGKILEEDSLHLLPRTGGSSTASSVNGRNSMNLLSGRLGELSV